MLVEGLLTSVAVVQLESHVEDMVTLLQRGPKFGSTEPRNVDSHYVSRVGISKYLMICEPGARKRKSAGI